jgi:hypothetical protein
MPEGRGPQPRCAHHRDANRACDDAARELLEWTQKNIDQETAQKLSSLADSLRLLEESTSIAA